MVTVPIDHYLSDCCVAPLLVAEDVGEVEDDSVGRCLMRRQDHVVRLQESQLTAYCAAVRVGFVRLEALENLRSVPRIVPDHHDLAATVDVLPPRLDEPLHRHLRARIAVTTG